MESTKRKFKILGIFLIIVGSAWAFLAYEYFAPLWSQPSVFNPAALILIVPVIGIGFLIIALGVYFYR